MNQERAIRVIRTVMIDYMMDVMDVLMYYNSIILWLSIVMVDNVELV